MSSGHINSTESSLCVSNNLCAEPSLSLGDEPSLGWLSHSIYPILYLGTGHSVGYKLCTLHSVNLSSCYLDNSWNVNGLCSEVGTCDKHL